MTNSPPFSVGDSVRRRGAKDAFGTVVSVFKTLSDEWLVCVECTIEMARGAIYVYAPERVERINNDH